MDHAPDDTPAPEVATQVGCSLTSIFLHLATPVAMFGLARLGWAWLGWPGIVLGVVVAFPLICISIGLFGLIIIGLAAVFNRAEYDLIVGKTLPDE